MRVEKVIGLFFSKFDKENFGYLEDWRITDYLNNALCALFEEAMKAMEANQQITEDWNWLACEFTGKSDKGEAVRFEDLKTADNTACLNWCFDHIDCVWKRQADSKNAIKHIGRLEASFDQGATWCVAQWLRHNSLGAVKKNCLTAPTTQYPKYTWTKEGIQLCPEQAVLLRGMYWQYPPKLYYFDKTLAYNEGISESNTPVNKDLDIPDSIAKKMAELMASVEFAKIFS